MRRIRWIAAALALLVALPLLAIPLSQYSTTAASNNMAVPDGAPENWTGAQVNDTLRQFMSVVRAWYDDPQWLDITYDLSVRGTKTFSRVDADTIDILATNATAYFLQGRRIRIVGSSTVTCYVATNATLNGSDTRIEVGTSCTVPTSPTAIHLWFGYDARSGAFVTAGQTLEGVVVGRGLLAGRIAWASVTQVTIGRGYNQKLTAEIDGVLAESSSDLTVDITTADREDTAACGGSAAEQASTWYYLYLDEASGVLVEHLSSTAPVMDPASGKVGYHPGTCSGSTGWRALGAVYNNASSDLEGFDVIGGGWWVFRKAQTASPFTVSLSSPIALSNYTTQSLSGGLPATARAARINVMLHMDNGTAYYGHESLSGTAVASNPSPNKLRATSSGGATSFTLPFDVGVDSTPVFAYGGGTGTNFTAHDARIVGWRDDLGLLQ